MRNAITDMMVAFRKDKTVLKQSQFKAREFSAQKRIFSAISENKYRYCKKLIKLLKQMSVCIASSDIHQNAFRQTDLYLAKLFKPHRVYVASINNSV